MNRSKEIRFVRFLLSPDPDQNMKTRSASQTKNIVPPTAPKEEEFKFGAANSWNRDHLDKIGVILSRKKKFDLDRILKIKESEWPDVMRARMPNMFP